EDLRSLRIIGSPVQEIRQVVDLMAFDTDDDWDVARERMTRVPDAVAGYEATLREGMTRGVVSARRQALACAAQADAWGGDQPFFKNLIAPRGDDAGLISASEAATQAFAQLGEFLRNEYAPV